MVVIKTAAVPPSKTSSGVVSMSKYHYHKLCEPQLYLTILPNLVSFMSC